MAPITPLRLNTPAMSYKPTRFAGTADAQDRPSGEATGLERNDFVKAFGAGYTRGVFKVHRQSLLADYRLAGAAMVNAAIHADELLTGTGGQEHLEALRAYPTIWRLFKPDQKRAFIDGVKTALDMNFGDRGFKDRFAIETMVPVCGGSLDIRKIMRDLEETHTGLEDVPQKNTLNAISNVLGVTKHYGVAQNFPEGIKQVRAMACLGDRLPDETKRIIRDTYWKVLEEAVLKEPLAAYRN